MVSKVNDASVSQESFLKPLSQNFVFLIASESSEAASAIVRASRTIYVIAAIMAVLIIAFVSIVVYLKVQHVKWGLPSKRSSTGSISKSTQSTLQPPSVEITKSMTDIKSCILNEVKYIILRDYRQPSLVVLQNNPKTGHFWKFCEESWRKERGEVEINAGSSSR